MALACRPSVLKNKINPSFCKIQSLHIHYKTAHICKPISHGQLCVDVQVDTIYDIGKYTNTQHQIEDSDIKDASALHYAAASGDPEVLKLFLDNRNFNPMVITRSGKTALHYATDATIPSRYPYETAGEYDPTSTDASFNRLILISEVYSPYFFQLNVGGMGYSKGYSGKQGCINLLLQTGVDIWQKDDDNKIPDPGPEASHNEHLWWHDRIARETADTKGSLNQAGNAIAVVAALIATTSFVGPLQPPLGYGSDPSNLIDLDFVQATKASSVQVFMVSNSLSFYFAIASIMFAVAPSLPMPQEGLLEDLQRARNAVALALGILLLSTVCVLVSFAAASNAVMPVQYSWQHQGLTFYPTLVGGFSCAIGVLLFCLRLLRLTFYKNVRIRYLYQKFAKV